MHHQGESVLLKYCPFWSSSVSVIKLSHTFINQLFDPFNKHYMYPNGQKETVWLHAPVSTGDCRNEASACLVSPSIDLDLVNPQIAALLADMTSFLYQDGKAMALSCTKQDPLKAGLQHAEIWLINIVPPQYTPTWCLRHCILMNAHVTVDSDHWVALLYSDTCHTPSHSNPVLIFFLFFLFWLGD